MFFRWDLLTVVVVEVNRRMTIFGVYGGNDPLSLLTRIRIKTYFLLERPAANFPEMSQMSQMCRWSLNIAKYGKEGSIVCEELSICWQIIRKVVNINQKYYWSEYGPIEKLAHLKQVTTRCFLKLRKSLIVFKMLPDIPFCLSSCIRPLCHTLSNALDKSKKTALTSWLSSKDC